MTEHARKIVATAWQRVVRQLNRIWCPTSSSWPTNEDVQQAWQNLADFHAKTTRQLRFQRISQWKEKMKASSLSNKTDLYNYLKRKHIQVGHAVLCDENNMPIFHQHDAIALAQKQWNEVFSANREHIPCEPALRVIREALRKRSALFANCNQ